MKRNIVIQRLIEGKTVFSTLPITNGDISTLSAVAQSSFEMAIVEMEHQGFDFPALRNSLQHLMSRRRVIASGSVIDPAPFVRIPASAREQNQWIIKQTLDSGAMGLVVPHFDTVEGAEATVRAARYPQERGSARSQPEGLRGWGPFTAADYWGLSLTEYYDCADLWPLNPDGEILLMGICETVAGVRALPDILKRVKGIGAIWAGQGDLSVSMGLRGDSAHPDVEKEVHNILKICHDHGVACATAVTRAGDVLARVEQGFDIVLLPTPVSFEHLNRGMQKVGRA